MTTAEDGPDREHESQAEAPAPADETPTPLRKAAAGVAEAQAWKGQQIAKGWRKLVNALRRREGGRFVSWSQRRRWTGVRQRVRASSGLAATRSWPRVANLAAR
jgi:hypothetical protein